MICLYRTIQRIYSFGRRQEPPALQCSSKTGRNAKTKAQSASLIIQRSSWPVWWWVLPPIQRFCVSGFLGFYTALLKENQVRYNKCDRSEQKQPFGCTLTNPPHVTPLRLGSTVIDGFSRAIYQKIADFNSNLLMYQFWKSVYKCGAGTQWRSV